MMIGENLVFADSIFYISCWVVGAADRPKPPFFYDLNAIYSGSRAAKNPKLGACPDRDGRVGWAEE